MLSFPVQVIWAAGRMGLKEFSIESAADYPTRVVLKRL